MRKINESDFVNYTIDANGWTLTVNTFQNAVNEWKGLNRSGCTLYGNKANGSRAIIDSKQFLYLCNARIDRPNYPVEKVRQ